MPEGLNFRGTVSSQRWPKPFPVVIAPTHGGMAVGLTVCFVLINSKTKLLGVVSTDLKPLYPAVLLSKFTRGYVESYYRKYCYTKVIISW